MKAFLDLLYQVTLVLSLYLLNTLLNMLFFLSSHVENTVNSFSFCKHIWSTALEVSNPKSKTRSAFSITQSTEM